MNRIKHIALREFKTRVRKKSFLISTIMGPILMLALMIVPIYFSSDAENKETTVAVINFPFEIKEVQGTEITPIFLQNQNIPDSILDKFDISVSYILRQNKATPVINYYFNSENKLVESYISTTIQNQLYDLPQPLYKKIKVNQQTSPQSSILLFYSYAAPILIYFFIFLYGMQIMKGITEEKTNRIIEVLLCTVKPFELMIGKIMGIFTLALLQFSIWAFSSFSLYSLFYSFYHLDRFKTPFMSGSVHGISDEFGDQLHSLVTTLTPDTVIGLASVFVIYFIGGYFLFGAMFAIVGAASDPDTDTQQFIFPITVPLISSFMLLDYIITNPESKAAWFMSIFPFTSPIIMPACFGSSPVEWWRLVISVITLVLGFLALTWVAARIYRIGILSSGSKVTYRTLVKWFLMKS